MPPSRPLHPDTLAVHGAQTLDSDFRSRAVPIYQTTSYVFRDTQAASALFNLETAGHIYSRISNPTVEVFENRMAQLEGGVGALATASGHSAITIGLLNLLRSRDEIVSANQIYGGTFTLLNHTFRKFGIHTWFVDIQKLDEVEQAITERTKVLFCEMIGNPALNIPDIERLAAIAHAKGIPLMVDATVPSPALFRAFDWGADMVVHSATKYIGGHGTSIGGILADRGKFDWNSLRFPEFTVPSASYHGKVFAEAFGSMAYIVKARADLLRDFGCALSPFNAFLFLQGLETLPLRMQRHSENALALADWLGAHPKVAWVNYPGLDSHPDRELARKYLPHGSSGLLTFGVKGGIEAGRRFIESVQLASFLANIGDAKTLVLQPATSTHSQLSKEERQMSGVTGEMIRVSVGLEHIGDIQQDFDQALGKG